METRSSPAPEMPPEAATEPAPAAPPGEARLIAFLKRPGLGLRLVFVALTLSLPCLFLGFYLDDYIARYIYSDLPGAERFYALLQGGYGLANGVPEDNHFQIEAGWAPWWTYERLHLALYRPVSLATHLLDARFWLDSALLMHAQNLAWLAVLVLVVTRLYRGAMGTLAAGMAALLFAVDHTHGFAVGYICNRHALVTATFGVLSLDQYLRSRRGGGMRSAGLAASAYVLALFSGESAVAIAAYAFAYALFVDDAPLARRALSLAPYLLITIVWRVGYTLAGYGASGSGTYVDPAREPLSFALALMERGPILLLGLFFAPPAELYGIASPWLARGMLGAAALVFCALCVAFVPLLRRDRMARFWAAGLLCSLVPAATTYPHNRQLLFASLGGMALIAQAWRWHALELRGRELSRGIAWSGRLSAVFLFVHLVVSPLVLPITTSGIAFAKPLQSAPDQVGDEIAGRDAVFVTAPEYFAVKLVKLVRLVEHEPLPRRLRALSFGAQAVTVTRTDEHTLELAYEGGILDAPFMELYRDRRIPMRVGERVQLEGLHIEVSAVTSDRRAERARFRFETPLEADSFRFYAWIDGRFAPFTVPAVGQRKTLPPATLAWTPW